MGAVSRRGQDLVEGVPRHPTQEQVSRNDESTNFPPAPFAQDLWSGEK